MLGLWISKRSGLSLDLPLLRESFLCGRVVKMLTVSPGSAAPAAPAAPAAATSNRDDRYEMAIQYKKEEDFSGWYTDVSPLSCVHSH